MEIYTGDFMDIKEVITHKKEELAKLNPEDKNFSIKEKRLIKSINRHKKELRKLNKHERAKRNKLLRWKGIL